MLAFSMPPGTYGRLATRSSMAMAGIDVCAGVIDGDYRGEIKVLLHNRASTPYYGKRGDKVAQLIPTKIELPMLCELAELSPTERNDQGFGSSGQ